VWELIDDAREKGAHLLVGGKREENMIYPTLFDNVTTDMRLAWEEPFGPVLPIIRVKDKDEAIEIANKSEYGLQSSVFTENINEAFYVADRLEVGTVQVNNKTERGPDHFPFLGVKASGIGTQGIRYSIESMSRPKATVINLVR
ncbi:aldehyde dehydrogenase family protein, partial [Clostridium perfringens]